MLLVTDGITLSAAKGYLGYLSGSSGSATVTGPGSAWSISGEFLIVKYGSGTLAIQNGARVTNASSATIGRESFSSGSVVVEGAGSNWTVSGDLTVAYRGTGDLTITQASTVTSTNGTIGDRFSGEVTVSGAGSVWSNSGFLIVGNSANGSLTIVDGGFVVNGVGEIGRSTDPNSRGTVTVSGAGSKWTNNSHLIVGSSGTGTLVVLGDGVVSAGSGMTIGTKGKVQGDGTVMANVTNSGVVDPAGSTAVLDIDGNYSQKATGVLQIALLSHVNFEKLNVIGNVAFGGKLEVTLGGFVPLGSRSFDILDWTGTKAECFHPSNCRRWGEC